MTFALSGWMLYTMWAIFGLMFVDFLISFFRSASGSLPMTMFLNYLKDVLNYVLPLMIIANMISLDPTGWVMLIGYYVGGIAIIWNYVNSIRSKF